MLVLKHVVRGFGQVIIVVICPAPVSKTQSGVNSVITNLFFVLPFPLPPLAPPNILDHASCCLVAGFRPILLHPLLICASMSAIRVCLAQTGQGTSSSGGKRDESDCFIGEKEVTNLGIALPRRSHAVAHDQTRLRRIVERCRIVIS